MTYFFGFSTAKSTKPGKCACGDTSLVYRYFKLFTLNC